MKRPPALNAKDLHAQGLVKKTARAVQAYVDWLEAALHASQTEIETLLQRAERQEQRHLDDIEDVGTIMTDCMPSPQWGFYE